MSLTDARRLMEFIDASPSPFHACAETARRLDDAGFVAVDEATTWTPGDATAGYVVRGGSLVAWRAGDHPPETPIRMIGAHTDSPNLRVKPRPDRSSAGARQLGVEVYGGALLNSWLDRDLGLSGRVTLRGEVGTEERLVLVDRPVLRVPQLAIHLHREIMEEGLKLNPQQHLSPMWGLGETDEGGFVRFLAAELDVAADTVLAWDVMTHDLTPSAIIGRDDDLLSAPRLDNLASSFAGLEALLAVGDDAAGVTVLCLFDHEEVGSTSDRGAASALLPAVLERLGTARGGDREALLRSLAGSICLSADMAHATHPNYADRHEPEHRIALNGGPVVKANANLRYASDARSVGVFMAACADAGVPVQHFVNRTDLPCGSTIGPLTAAELGISTVDVGMAQLAMHSARELAGSADPTHYREALTAFLHS